MSFIDNIRRKKGDMSWGAFLKGSLIFRANCMLDPLLIPLYRRTIGRKVRAMRNKDCIRVAFVVPELGFWKTEALYVEMLRHQRFQPILLITPSTEVPTGADVVERYFQNKGYAYVDMRKDHRGIWRIACPDIIFYEKPYDYSLAAKYNFRRNARSLFCYVSYCFHNVNVREINETPLVNASWQVYYENPQVMEETEQLMLHPCGNGVVTGLPNADDLLATASRNSHIWKDLGDGGRRKRIIWAPHHSVGKGDHEGMDYSTFLVYADFMLEMAKKYADKLQMVFKPHPLLKKNLRECWSEERIEAYYQQWEQLPNTQLELGDYKELFVQSDAMIHDCGSFTIEYLYTQHPVMYLLKHDHHEGVLNQFATDAFRMHYLGYTETDVEQFIQDVIEGRDTRCEERRRFFETSLRPPYGKTASQNIIDAILS